ncbi:hypothetical protein RHECNPAF_350007 [Rhizobium etli CNPAF512]|nr:hypothetical protein RHECNPAF_350007 [Rhizobium etli CNPAF512]
MLNNYAIGTEQLYLGKIIICSRMAYLWKTWALQ